MNKTIAQIAKEQGVSTQAIYQRIKRLQDIDKAFASHIYKDESKRTVIDDIGQEMLFEGIGNISKEDLQDVTNDYIEKLNEHINLLTSQLQIKDQQIETLQTLVSQAHTLAQTAQLTEGKKSIFDWFKRDKKEN